MSPRSRSSAERCATRLTPPRTLNAPVGRWFSCLTSVSVPTSSVSPACAWSGVRGRCGAIARRASRTSRERRDRPARPVPGTDRRYITDGRPGRSRSSACRLPRADELENVPQAPRRGRSRPPRPGGLRVLAVDARAADAVVADVDRQDPVLLRDRDPDARCPGVLDGVRHRLGSDVVRGRLQRRRKPRGRSSVELDGERARPAPARSAAPSPSRARRGG